MLTRTPASAKLAARVPAGRVLARFAAVVATATAMIAWAATAAHAGSHLDCPSPHHCVVAVGSASGGGGEGGNGGVSGGGGDRTCHPLVPAGDECYMDGLGWWDGQDACWYLNEGGDEYSMRCVGGDHKTDHTLLPPVDVILPEPPAGYGGPADPLRAAAKAINSLDIAGPRIVLAPDGVGGLVGLPVWMSTQVTGETWGTVTATASIPGLSATAAATAQWITWDMGDGHSVVCENPGTAYRGTGVTSPDCGYVYQNASYDRPGGRYTVTATTTWMVTWTATDGAFGWVTVDATSTTTLAISDLQVVVG